MSKGTGPDLNLDQRAPIMPPDMANMTPENFNQAVDAAVERAVKNRDELFQERLSQEQKAAQKNTTIASLNAFIQANPGEDLPSLQFKSGIQNLLMECIGDSEKTHDQFMAEATKLAEARAQVVLEAGGDGAQDLPLLRKPNERDDGRFSLTRFMVGLTEQVKEEGDKFDGEKLKGTAEAEYVTEMMDKNPAARDMFSSVLADAESNQRVVPVPMASLRPDIGFAQNLATDITSGDMREPDYRRDALIPHFRPPMLLAQLGVGMPIISNDITVPYISGSISAAYLAETAAAAEQAIAVAPVQSTPHRLAAKDELTWMMLVAGGRDFGIEPLVVSEMVAAVAQAKENAVYQGTGTAPTGIKTTSGITNITNISGNSPTYLEMQQFGLALANLNLPLENCAFVFSHNTRVILSNVRRFGTGSDTVWNTVAMTDAMGRPTMGSAMMGEVDGFPAYATTQIPVAGSGNTDIFFGVWPFCWCVDYATAFITIDDISLAQNGQTRITINAFNDVIVRRPDAFIVETYDSTA